MIIIYAILLILLMLVWDSVLNAIYRRCRWIRRRLNRFFRTLPQWR